MSIYHRWLRICTDGAYIGSAVLAVWAIPLLHQEGFLALLPAAGLLLLAGLAFTAAGCVLLWIRHEWPTFRARLWLASPGHPLPAWEAQQDA